MSDKNAFICHQDLERHIYDGPYRRPTAVGAQSHTCKGSGIKHVVHHMPVGLQRSRMLGERERDNVVYWKTNGKINNDLQCW